MAENWSREEVEAAVADYFDMLSQELKGKPFSKAEHNRQLASLLRQRSKASIERKHQNISAVLNEAHFPWIFGYKPLGNYQTLLADVVLDRLSSQRHLELLAAEIATKDAGPLAATDLLFEKAPAHASPGLYIRDERDVAARKYRASHVDHFHMEARNRSLGAAGEQLVIQSERARLIRAGAMALADRVEWVSKVRGDGAGYDVLSFEESGAERFIEVKTTGFGKETPFFVSRNEVNFSQDFRDQYQLYRLFTFRDQPRVYTLPGALEESCRLEANAFVARVR